MKKKYSINFLLILILSIITMLMWSNRKLFLIINNYYMEIFTFFNILLFTINIKQIARKNKIAIISFLILIIVLIFMLEKNGTGLGSIAVILNTIIIYYYSTAIENLNRSEIKTILSCYVIMGIAFCISEKTGYNSNTVGMISLINIIMLTIYYTYCNKKTNKILSIFFIIINIFQMGISDARSSIMGLMIFFILMIVPNKIISNKIVYKPICLLATIGSIIWISIYIYMWENNIEILTSFSNKSFFSGRQNIWYEVLNEFYKNPIWGLGSKYVLKSHGEFECHNYMLNMMAVYGLIIFVPFLVYTIKFLFNLCGKMYKSKRIQIMVSGVIATFLVGFFENNLSTFKFMIFNAILYVFIFSEYKTFKDEKKEEKKKDERNNYFYTNIQ